MLKLGFSPCPNDTFIFDALVHGKIDTEGLRFEPVLEDVEALNQLAATGGMDVTKLSYHAFAHMVGQYAMLQSGSALGRGCGPLLVARHPMPPDAIEQANIVIPGRLTTANFLLSLAFPNAVNKRELIFSAIEDEVAHGRADAGLIIHENRFTYTQKGLVELMDLGKFWEETTGMPIPLGGIVVNRNLPPETRQRVQRVLRRSVEYAFANPSDVMPYVRQHAQAMEESVMKAHIDLYVNDFTIDLREEGRAAIKRLFDMAVEKEIIGKVEVDIFV